MQRTLRALLSIHQKEAILMTWDSLQPNKTWPIFQLNHSRNLIWCRHQWMLLPSSNNSSLHPRHPIRPWRPSKSYPMMRQVIIRSTIHIKAIKSSKATRRTKAMNLTHIRSQGVLPRILLTQASLNSGTLPGLVLSHTLSIRAASIWSLGLTMAKISRWLRLPNPRLTKASSIGSTPT